MHQTYSNKQARVVYGDTDSVFVLLRGRTKEQAFAIGKEIADRITSLSPEAVVLKLEKVYTRCFMISKKRYVGYSYESPEQKEGSYDAKGALLFSQFYHHIKL